VKTRTTFLAGILAPCCVLAAPPQPYRMADPPAWVDVAPDESLVAADAKAVEAGESDYPLVDRQVRVSNVTSYYQRYVQRLLSQADVDSAAQVTIEIDPGHEKVLLHGVRVLRDGRVIDKLADARRSLLNRESELEDGLINGRVTLHVLLQDVRVGDVLDYSYTSDRVDPISERGYYGGFTTQWALPVRHSRLRVLEPADRTLQVKDLSGGPAPVRARRNGWNETVWDVRDVVALSDESARPSWHFRYPRIELSEFADWNAVRDWALPMYAIEPRKDAAMDALLAGLRAEPDEKQRILRALRFVQDDIRYTGLEIGAGAWRPSQPGVVLARRYGDCKDKVLLLTTLLQTLGIEAWPALVHSSAGRGLKDRLPSPGAFDHVIAKVRSNGADYWLDATTSGQGGALDTLVQADFGPALLLAPGASGLAQIPERDGRRASSRVKEIYDFRKGTGKVARFTVRSVYYDEDADSMRVKMRSKTATELGKEYFEYYKKNHGNVRIVAPLRYTDDREKNRFTVEESYEIDKPFVKDGDEGRKFHLKAYLITEQTGKPDETVRTSPLARRFPMHVSHEIVAYLPGPWDIEDERTTVTDDAFEYRSSTRFADGKLELEYDLRNTRDHVPVAALQKFLEKLDEAHDSAYFTLTDPDEEASGVSLAPPRGPSIEMFVAMLVGIGFGALATFLVLRRRPEFRRPAF
jgi:transglutaminase-like putative cysteine protease